MPGTYLIKRSNAPAALTSASYANYASATQPSSPVEGSIWVDTGANPIGIPKVYSSGAWEVCGTIVPPLTQNTDTSLTFVGYRSPVYGEALWTNMLHMLENFAAPTAPRNPIVGQIWVNTATSPGIPKVFNKQGIWETIGAGLIISDTQPAAPDMTDPVLYPPDMWLNPTTGALYYWNVNHWSAINCTVVASQIEYNTAYDLLIGAITATSTIGQPGFGKIPTTEGTDNRFPTTAEWHYLLATYRDLCGAIAGLNNGSGVSPANNKFWVDARTAFFDASNNNENFIWCPGGATSATRGMLSYTFLLDLMKTAATNAATWASTPDLTAAGAVDFALSSITSIPGQQITATPNAPGATSWLWDFGNGVTSALERPPATAYPNPGVYTITLTASNSKSTQTVQHQITSYVKPVASFDASRTLVDLPSSNFTITFTDRSQNNPTGWRWTITNHTTGATVYFNATQNYIQWTFSTAGVYDVTLVASNQAGESTNVATAQVIAADAPVAQFTYSPTAAVAQPPLTVQFTDTSYNSPTEWLWNFGDGTTSTDQNPQHLYTTSGIFTVKLTVTNFMGTNSIVVANCVATVITPEADFLPAPSQPGQPAAIGTPPLVVQFTDTSRNNPTNWNWDFGDGATSTLQNPQHTYSQSVAGLTYVTPGTYTYTIPSTMTSLSYTYLTPMGEVDATMAVTPGQQLQIVIGQAGSVSTIGSATLPKYDQPVASFSGSIDAIMIETWGVVTPNAASYSGTDTSGPLIAGAAAVGITYGEYETNRGDMVQSIAINTVKSSTLLTNPTAYYSIANGRDGRYWYITQQPTPANSFVMVTNVQDNYADPSGYSFTVNLKHVTAIRLKTQALSYAVTLTASNLAGTSTKSVQNLVSMAFNASITLSVSENNVDIFCQINCSWLEWNIASDWLYND